ncbi:uncharacterized protein ACWYII_031249 isoform 1-T2 [Salvelinus alpinus]
MACTRQSALEYIQNGRRLLVERLQNLSLVVENLFQRKVLQEEEVSKIQAEVDRFDQTRKILDWVTAKGEAACYELLMILDITRKRTLDNADLQQWISCFPFKEDPEMTDYLVGSKPCHRYQSQLKCKARKITEGAWKQSSRLLPERNRNEVTFSYTPLVLDTDVPSSLSKIETKSKRCKKARPKKLKSFIPMAKQETSPADLLKTPMRRILLFGKPGIGKTAVAHQMLNLWAQKDHRELDYMFYFDVRDISPSTNPMRLEDLLFNMYSEPEESREEVLQDIKKNSENVVIIFDGITYLSSHSVIKKLVDKDLLPDAKIVITCRPEVPSRDFLTDWPSFRVEVKGFSNESIRAYLIKMLSAEPNPTPNHDSLSSVLNNLELFSLCHVPMYALMVVACIYYSTPEASKQPWPTTKMYINILRYCILKHSGKQTNDLNKCLVENREKILSLAKIAFDATQQKTMNLTELSCELSSVQFSFLGALMIMVEPTVSDTYSAFLHYTMQEFFGALWLLQNPDKIREVLQKCQTEEWKHTKHMVPFMCGLLNERNIQLVNGLVPAQQTKKTSDWFLKEVVNTFLPLQTNQDHAEGDAPEFEIDLLFLCQCLYESQSTEACLLLLDKLDYNLDLDEEHLDPHQCCAVSYMISQSAERKVGLDLNSCTVSDQGLRLILASLKNVRYLGSDPSMLCQLWTTLLSGEADIDFTSLLGLCGNELRLPFLGERRVFERAEEVMKQSLERVNLLLHWDRTTLLSEALSKTILKCLTHINKLSFTPLQHQRGSPEKLEKEEKAVLLDLCLQAGLYHRETFQGAVNTLLSLFSVYQTERYDILLDLYSHVKYNRKQAGRSILPSLRPLYQPAPAVWSIDLSERKASLLLEVLKLQPEKKSVELKYWSDEESEVRSFLQCLPYISQLRIAPPQDQRRSPEDLRKREKTFLLNLCLQAALHERENIQTTVEKVSLSEVYHDLKWDLLLDLYSHVKNYETQTGRSVLPALQTVYQSAPAVWSIDLSERKVSLLLEVLKLQPEKKPVELWGWSDEESEVRSFLQCLPYISELGFIFEEYEPSELIKFLVGLLSQAAEWEEQSGEKTLKLLSSVCTYSTFPLCDWDDDKKWFQCDFLLDLYSHVKDYETQTGRSVLPALQTVYQSAPAVWYIDLSERKASLLLEVLKLQSEKKPVQLEGWSDEDSEVRSFLQCLPYISQLRFLRWSSDNSELIKFLVGLLSQAAEWEEQSGEKTLKLVSSVCTYSTFPLCDGDDYDTSFQCDFLLDLYSHVKDYETQTGRSVLPALQPVYQSAPAVWSIDLSERKVSLLLDVLKLQPVKKPVELKGWSDEESEVRSFLQCLPYISQLRRRGGKQPLQLLNCSCSFTPPQYQRRSPEDWRKREKTFLLNMCLQAALHERETIQTTVEKVLSLSEVYHDRKWDLLLDLYSHVKDYETQTGRSVLPALQPVYQSAPAVWSIDLSERKASLLLEVLKLQPGKKPVELKYWSDEESEVRSFLQCLPYISQLSFPPPQDQRRSPEEWRKREKTFLLNLCLQAALHERETIQTTVEKVLSLSEVYHDRKWSLLLDLYSHVKDYETQTGRSVLPALQPVYQSAPAVWSIDLSERKASLLLEVLKLQPEKKPVQLEGWSDEESEVRSFLQCLPYISQLSFPPPQDQRRSPEEWRKREKTFLLNLCLQAALHERETIQTTVEKVLSLSEVYHDRKWSLLLDLYSHVKDYETQTGRSVLPALQPVYQSAPAVWSIDLSERKASLLLEVLKLQPEKKPVQLEGWSDEESEVRSFLQCLPYISQLSFPPPQDQRRSPEDWRKREKTFLLNMCLQAALHERENIQTTVEKVSLSEVYHDLKWDLLLDLYSHVKNYETQTGRSVLPALQTVYQSAPAVWSIDLSERKVSLLLEVLKLQPEKKPVELWGWSDEESEVRSFLQCLPYISELGFIFEEYEPSELIKFLVGLLSQAAEWEEQSGEKTLKLLSSVCTYSTFPLCDWDDDKKWFQCDFLLDLYSHVKDYETQTGRSVLPALQTVYQSAPAVWYIDLSERKASLLLEVLKLQSEKKPVQLEGWSDEDSEVRSFLQCLPYISQLRFLRWSSDNSELIKFLVGLLSQAAEWEEQSGEKTLKLVSSVCTYSTFPLCDGDDYDTSFQCDFLLDLYSHVKDYETQTGRSVLPALQPVYQSAPAVWSIDLSERKVSLLLDVLKLQPVKKPVELKGWSDEESEVRSFLQCLPYISQLRRRGGKQPLQLLNCSCSFTPPQYQRRSPEDWRKREKTFLLNMCLQAALHERETIQTTVEKVLSLSEVYHDRKWDLLLDLYSHVKDYETQTGRSVLPALQPVYQSAPAVWSIDLSERKASLLLEVLKLQPGKKPVELKYWSDEESEVRSFLQCLPYISQLSFHLWRYEPSELIKFLVGLLSQAAEWEEQSGEKTLKLLSSVCTYSTFPLCDWDDDKKWFQCDFLLDLYSHVKDYETQTGRSVLPALQPVYQSAPAVWSIDLSERKASLLLEVLKLQPGKKPVELNYWSDEESEVRSFLQCLPYISQLSFHLWRYEPSELIKFLVGLLSQAAEWEEQSGEKTLKLLSSVCTYSTFPLCDWDDDKKWFQSDFLLDLYSHVKDYETQTGRSVLPALQPVYQSAPAVWSIDLSERKVSLLLDVLKLQPEKKPVELKGWSDEDNQVRSFLQCLPYISQLSCDSDRFFQRVCESIPVRSREDAQHLASLLQALGSTLSLGDQLPRKTCRSVVRVLGLCASRVDLTLTPSKISLKGASLLFTRVSQLHKLRLNVGMSVRLARLARRTWRGGTPLTVPELSLVLKSSQPPERVLSRALSSVASLLRFWRVQCLDLTDFCIQGHSLITLLCHQGPLTLRLHSDTLQQLAVVVYEAQDKDLTQWFLEKVGGDLTSCRLDWEVLLSLLQHSTHNITVDLRKNRLPEKNISDLLPFLGRVIFKRLSSSFVKSIIRQIYNSRDSDCVSSLLRSSAQWINLNSRELDRVDCTSLCFTLQHSHQVKVNLLWTSIPPGEIESILPLLDRVSQLSVDRKLLLSFLHSCAASQILQGALSPTTTTTAAELLRALQYRLDFSCSSSVDLSAHDQGGALCLTTDHCRAINSVLKQSQHSTRLVQNPTQNQSRNQPHVQLILKD